MCIRWIIYLFFLVSHAWAQQLITKVIGLHYQSADAVIKLVRPLLQNNEQITGTGQTLIVKVSPQTLTQLRTILHKIDQPPITFQISIFQGASDWLSSQNNNTTVITTSSHADQQRRQSVRVMNGETAFISTGKDQPVISSVGIGLTAGISYAHRSVQNGLLVEPTLQGQKVKLTVRRIREQEDPLSNQQSEEQKVMTTLLVSLDKWVPLASPESNASTEAMTEVYHAGNDSFSQNSTLYIKVSIVQKP